jgi:hypothetical protein
MQCITENEELEMSNEEFLNALHSNVFILKNKRFLKKNKSVLNTDSLEVLR